MEVSTSLDDFPIILKEEDGKIFEYTFPHDNIIKRSYIQAKEEFLSDFNNESDIDSIFYIYFKSDKGSISKFENTYNHKNIFTGYIR